MKEAKILEGVNENTAIYLQSLFKIRKFSAGEFIITEGSEGEELYIIKEGRVEILKDSVKIGELGEGETFGEMALIDKKERSATVKVMEDVTLFELKLDDFNKLKQVDINSYATIIFNLARELSERIRDIDDKLQRIWKWYVNTTS